MRAVWIEGAKFSLAPAALVGQGGEAEIYDLGDGRVVKWWKPADHADFVGDPAAQAAARTRIASAPAKLRALPGGLPGEIVAPCGWALAGKRSSDVVGYVMPRVAGVALHALGEPKWRRDNPVPGERVVASLLALHRAITALHAAGIVVGDFNDLNVLVDVAAARVHLIDVDSYQFGGHACPMFSERFVDPRLCDAQQLVPVRPHDRASDWFAFAVMAFRSLLGVGPWGGVHQPAIGAKCPPPLRALRRVSVLGEGIVYPRAARPLAILPDDLRATFRAIFERDVRGEFPRDALERLRLRACTQCGEEHGAVRCPTCATLAQRPPVVVAGRLSWTALDPASVALATREVRRAGDDVWLDGDVLMRAGTLGPERIGSVLAGQTRAWVGPSLGVGFYRAGGYAVGFVFRPARGVLDDRVKLPPLRGQLVDTHAVIGTDRAWLFFTLAEAGRLTTRCVVVGADASILATAEVTDTPWRAGITGACAAGPNLFVPTDDGIARIEVTAGSIAHTRTFSETAPLVGGGDRLALSSSGAGIDVVRARDAIRLVLS